MSFRPVKSTSLATPHIEGAGVHLHRAFDFGDPTRLDPFLMFDDFRGDHPSDYRAGFPWHPHRGIETITYVLAGAVDHGDSLGNRGTLKGGDVQWMTAGSGILHQEMPKGNGQGQMHGFQLWANLPRELKMTAPRYQDVRGSDIPELLEDDAIDNFTKYKARRQSLSYIYTQNLDKAFSHGLNKPFEIVEGEYPYIVGLYLRKSISPETMVILNDYIPFFDKFDKYLGTNDVIWSKIALKLRRYKPFLKYDREKFKTILKEKIDEVTNG
jgi:hypothetical protein